MEARTLDLSEFNQEVDLELTGVELTNSLTLIVSVYRSPNGNFCEFMNKFDDCLSRLPRNKPILIGGDFNVPLNLDSDPHTISFKNLIRSHGMFVTTTEPTRGDRCLDSIVTNMDSWDYSVRVTEPCIADHGAVVLMTNLEGVSRPNDTCLLPWSSNYSFTYRLINDKLLVPFKVALGKVNWDELADHGSSLCPFENFFNTFYTIFNLYFPEKSRHPAKCHRSQRTNPTDNSWYTPELSRLRNLVLLLKDNYRSSVTLVDKNRFHKLYCETKHLYKCRIDFAKKLANTRFIENASNPCQAAWKLLNRHKGTSKPAPKCTESPDVFNRYLLQSVETIVDSIPPTHQDPLSEIRPPGNHLTYWRSVTPMEVVKIVRHFRNSQSSDVYGISVSVLRSVIDVIAAPISSAINDCLKFGYFPNFLSVSRTVPVFKKGDPRSMDSYRPISIIPVFAKVLETVIERQLIHHLETNDILSNLQHGFRRGRSTATAVIDLIDKIKLAFEERDVASLALCDLSKAFDCIPHKILLGKLERYGIGGVVLATFKSYLSNRQQVLSIHGTSSKPCTVRHGVPQGSVLGPVLFLVAVNDLSLDGKTLLFADDTTICYTGSPIAEVIKETENLLNRAKLWFSSNKLKLNEGKTQRMICSLGQQVDDNSESVKLLGFVIDPRLSWKKHTEFICTKLTRVVYLLRSLVHLVDEKYLVVAYHSLFHSHLIYGLLLWGHSSGCSEIFKLQKSALRAITRSGRLDHCRPLFQRLGILTLYSQYILDSVVYVKLSDFETREQHHHHGTRQRGEINIPFSRLSLVKDSFPHLAMKLYNRLPANVTSLDTPKFKLTMKNWLKSHPFYSLSEFFEEDFLALMESTAL